MGFGQLGQGFFFRFFWSQRGCSCFLAVFDAVNGIGLLAV
jgi:hypothetical protein